MLRPRCASCTQPAQLQPRRRDPGHPEQPELVQGSGVPPGHSVGQAWAKLVNQSIRH